LALKTLELRARRDSLVIFFLGFFTMISSFFNSQSLLTAAAMLLALLGMLTALVNAHMPVGRPPLAQAFRTAFTMALLGAPIMAALFVLFPRMAPLWGVPGDQMVGRTGLSGSMRVGSIAELALNEAVAFRIKFDDPAQSIPPASSLYFRGPVLSAFDGREWTAEPLREDSSWAARAGLPANLQVQGPALRYEVTLEPQRRPWLMVLESTPQPPELPGNPAHMTQDLQWMTTRPVTDVVRYRAESYPEFPTAPRHPGDSCANSRPCRQASTRARWPWQRKCVPTLTWRATTQPPWSKLPWRACAPAAIPTRWSLVCTASTRPMSSGLTVKKVFANTLPPPSWC